MNEIRSTHRWIRTRWRSHYPWNTTDAQCIREVVISSAKIHPYECNQQCIAAFPNKFSSVPFLAPAPKPPTVDIAQIRKWVKRWKEIQSNSPDRTKFYFTLTTRKFFFFWIYEVITITTIHLAYKENSYFCNSEVRCKKNRAEVNQNASKWFRAAVINIERASSVCILKTHRSDWRLVFLFNDVDNPENGTR